MVKMSVGNGSNFKRMELAIPGIKVLVCRAMVHTSIYANIAEERAPTAANTFSKADPNSSKLLASSKTFSVAVDGSKGLSAQDVSGWT